MFLRAYQRHGVGPADAGARRTSTSPSPAVVAKALGAVDVPATTAELRPPSRPTGPSWRARPAARSTARYLHRQPAAAVVAARAVPAAGRRGRRPAAALGPLAAAPAVAAGHRGHGAAGRRRGGHPHDPLGPARRHPARRDAVTWCSSSPRRSPRRRELLGAARGPVPRRRAGRRRRDARRRRAAGGRSSAAWRTPRRGRSTATRCSPPTRSSRSTARSSASRSTPTTPGGCCAGCRVATHLVHTAVAVRSGERRRGRGRDDVGPLRPADRRRRSSGTSPPGSRSTRPAPTPSRAPAARSSRRVEGSVSNVVGLPLHDRRPAARAPGHPSVSGVHVRWEPSGAPNTRMGGVGR